MPKSKCLLKSLSYMFAIVETNACENLLSRRKQSTVEAVRKSHLSNSFSFNAGYRMMMYAIRLKTASLVHTLR